MTQVQQTSFELAKIEIDREETKDRFALIAAAAMKVSRESAKEQYALESFQFKKLLSESPSLVGGRYTPISALAVFLDVVSNGLSFSASKKHVYVQSRSVKTGRKAQDGKDIYEERLYFTEQADGLIHLARKAGSVEDVDEPTIVYADDFCEDGTDRNGHDWVEYKAGPGKSTEIVMAFTHVTLANGERRCVKMKKRDWIRLSEYSAKNNRTTGKPNPLYTSVNNGIDPGFLATKLVKKALRRKDKTEVSGSSHVDDLDQIEQPVHTEDITHEEVQPTEQTEQTDTTQSSSQPEPF